MEAKSAPRRSPSDVSRWRRVTAEKPTHHVCVSGRDLTEAGEREAGLKSYQSRKEREAAARRPGRQQLGEVGSDVISARSQIQKVAAASAHGELVAAAAAWNCGGCVCPSAAGREAEGRGGEGHPALELRGVSGRCPSLLPPATPAPSQHCCGVPTHPLPVPVTRTSRPSQTGRPSGPWPQPRSCLPYLLCSESFQ